MPPIGTPRSSPSQTGPLVLGLHPSSKHPEPEDASVEPLHFARHHAEPSGGESPGSTGISRRRVVLLVPEIAVQRTATLAEAALKREVPRCNRTFRLNCSNDE
jgi:hypothetical protein